MARSALRLDRSVVWVCSGLGFFGLDVGVWLGLYFGPCLFMSCPNGLDLFWSGGLVSYVLILVLVWSGLGCSGIVCSSLVWACCVWFGLIWISLLCSGLVRVSVSLRPLLLRLTNRCLERGIIMY